MDRFQALQAYLLPLLITLLRVLVLLAVGYGLSVGLNRLFRGLKILAVDWLTQDGDPPDLELEKRASTILSVIRRPAQALLWAAVAMMVLQEFGFRVEPLLAGAGISVGIVGVAVGFGAQSLIKDMIAGIFILAENQIRLHDVAVINGTSGLVEEINLRTTVLRSENGAVHVFPNGSIQTLANLTNQFAQWVVEVTIGLDQDPARVGALLLAIGDELRTEEPYSAWILDRLEFYGVDRFVPSGIVIKGRLKTVAGKQWTVGREFNRRMQVRLQEAGVEPVSQVNLLKLDGGSGLGTSRDELKAVIREVLAEGKPEKG